MEYIVFNRFKAKAICGEVNLPTMTKVELIEKMLYWQDKPLCVITSENAHKFFARNNDGQGMERGRLAQAIIRTLTDTDEHYQSRWNKIWDDPICQKYKRKEYANYWLWNTAFYNAEISELEYIYNLIKEGKR